MIGTSSPRWTNKLLQDIEKNFIVTLLNIKLLLECEKYELTDYDKNKT